MSTTTQKLAGKVAIVTGASKGIGANIATHLAAAGATVVVNYSSSKEGADRVVDTIMKRGGKAVAVQANVVEESRHRSPLRRNQNGLRPPRHPRQQRRRLRIRRARSRHRRALPQAVQSQRPRPPPHHAKGGRSLRRRRRQRHQHQLRRRHQSASPAPPFTARPKARSTPSPGRSRRNSARRKFASTRSTPA